MEGGAGEAKEEGGGVPAEGQAKEGGGEVEVVEGVKVAVEATA